MLLGKGSVQVLGADEESGLPPPVSEEVLSLLGNQAAAPVILLREAQSSQLSQNQEVPNRDPLRQNGHARGGIAVGTFEERNLSIVSRALRMAICFTPIISTMESKEIT